MLAKAERLKERYLFNLVFKKNHKLSSNLFTLYFLTSKDINKLPKVAFVAPVSLDKRANKRNLVKRRMRNAYKFVKKVLSNISCLIWIAHPRTKNATFLEIKDTMKILLGKLEEKVCSL